MPVYVKYPDQEHIFSPPRRPVQSAHGSPMNASSLISRLQYLCARAGHWTLVDTWTWTHNEYRLWSPTRTKKFLFRTSATNFSWYQSKLKFYQKSTWLHTYNIELMCKYVTDAHLLPVYSGTAPGWESWQVCVVGLVDMDTTPLQSQFGYLVKTSPSQTSHVLHTNIPYSRIHVLCPHWRNWPFYSVKIVDDLHIFSICIIHPRPIYIQRVIRSRLYIIRYIFIIQLYQSGMFVHPSGSLLCKCNNIRLK